MSDDVLQGYRRALEGLLGVPATEGNAVDVLRNGDEIFPAMLDAIRAATSTVDFATYIYWTGDIAQQFAQALIERARAGVRVRILLDAVGAHLMNSALVDDLQSAGCQVEWFRPTTTWKVWESNHRTHRKVLICDEDVAFTGGVGIAAEWCGDARNPEEWRDTHVRIHGPAVDGLRAAFVSNWAETDHPLFDEHDRFPEQPQCGDVTVQVVQSPAQIGWSDLASAFAALIMLAQRRLRITTAYFVPDDRFLRLLCDAAHRGVEVSVLVPGEHADKRIVQLAGEENYADILDCGIAVHRYQPTMLHAKILTVDGLVAMVGSGNFDQRSLGINDEANIVVFDAATTAVFDAHFDEDLRRSERVDPEQWARRGPVQRVKEGVTELFDEQL
ncbi:MAG: phospholipase D-like domain-containing protein [Actinomycetota bacterium]|nr:phospholipase D-like domain-containing protein [Actinomycetota bacterium]